MWRTFMHRLARELRLSRNALWIGLFLVGTVASSLGQGEMSTQTIGLPANGSFSGSSFDNVQLNNGNLHIEIPLYSLSGRGLSVPVSVVYDSKGWEEWTSNPSLDTPVYVRARIWDPQFQSGLAYHNMAWTLVGPLTTGAVPWRIDQGNGTGFAGFGLFSKGQVTGCPGNTSASRSTTTYREPNGTSHVFPDYGIPGNPC